MPEDLLRASGGSTPSWKAIDQAPENTKKRRKPQQPDPERWCWVSLTKCVVCLHLLRIQANGRCALCELFLVLSRRIQPMDPCLQDGCMALSQDQVLQTSHLDMAPAARLVGLGEDGGKAGAHCLGSCRPSCSQLQAPLSRPEIPISPFVKPCPAQAGNLISRVKRLATLRVAAACLLLALPRSAALFTLTARSGSELF